MRHTGPLSGRALVGPPCTPVPGSERRLGAGDREARVCSPEWLRCSRMALGASSPRPGLVALGPLLHPRPACGYQGSQWGQPAPEPSSAAAPRQQGLWLLWGLLWGRGGPLPPAGISRHTPGCPHLLRLLVNNLPFQLARRSRAWRPYHLLVSFE